MTRSRAPAGQRPATRPLDQQQLAEEGEIAQRVQRVMDSIRDFDQDKVQATIWRKQGSATGSWQWCDDCSLPPDIPAVMTDMRERFGAGDYEIRVIALGRIRGNILFSIAKEKTAPLAPAAPPAPTGLGMADFLGMMLTQQSEARRDAQAAADRQMTMLTTLATAVLPAMLQRPPAPAGGLTAGDVAALVTALGTKGGSMKETLETMAAMKAILGPGEGDGEGGGGGGGLDPDDLVASAGRLIGPASKALGDFLARRQGGGEGVGPSASLPPPAIDGGGQLALGPSASRFRAIDLVRDDVVFMFARGHDPEKAADLVYDVIEANGVTDAEIAELAAAFALSPSGLEDLAREGLDLRSNPQWAIEFFSALNAIHTDAKADLGGAGGGEADTSGNG